MKRNIFLFSLIIAICFQVCIFADTSVLQMDYSGSSWTPTGPPPGNGDCVRLGMTNAGNHYIFKKEETVGGHTYQLNDPQVLKDIYLWCISYGAPLAEITFCVHPETSEYVIESWDKV